MAQTVGEIVCTVSAQWSPNPLTRGDRVRIREGYDAAGEKWYYVGKSVKDGDMAVVTRSNTDARDVSRTTILAAAIEPYPYTKDEKVEHAIEDLHALVSYDGCGGFGSEMHAALFALLEAGI